MTPHSHRSKRSRQVLRIAAVLGLIVLARSQASAQAPGSLIGSWRAGATAIDVSIESWGTDCGPRPSSIRSKGGGLVTIEQREQGLLLHGRDQDIRTDACWSRNPAMKKTTASYANGQWLTRCRTADNDPRAEQGTYTLKYLEPDSLQYKDVSVYDWTLNESKCVATFTTSQTLTRVAAGDKSARATRGIPARIGSNDFSDTAPPSAAEGKRCANPGNATAISVKPERAEIELGEKLCFRVRVSDDNDCNVPITSEVIYLLYQPKGLRGTLVGGCFTASDSAADGQGEFRVVVKRGDLHAESTIAVRRVDLSSIMARRIEGSALTGEEEDPGAGPASKAVARIDTRTAAVEGGSSRGPLVGIAAVALGLGGLGYWLVRRRSGALAGVLGGLTGSAGVGASLTGTTHPGRRLPNGDDSPTTDEVSSPGAEKLPAGNQPWICPTCRVGYAAEQTTCPKDGSALIPYAEFTQRSKREELEHGKRCPTCGKTFPASAAFCGEDGTSLLSVQ
ncbi:MAG: hypothetical protein ABW321_34225 [Polyangiales bacterium]